MLWVYINNQGTAQCVVNMGNKIRQGDVVKLFIVFPQEASDFISLENQLISYIKPGATEYTAVGVSCEEASFEFTLGNPSQANSFFTGGTTYDGWLVTLPEDATSFDGNGGHVGVSLVVENSMNESVHTEVIDFYVEPTYGKKWNKMTATDYATLLKLMSQRNAINLGNFDTFQTALEAIDGLRFPVDDETFKEPMPMYVFMAGGIPYFMFVSKEGENTIQTLAFIDQNGDLVYMRRTYRYVGGEWRWSLFEVSYSQPIKNMELTTDTSVHPNTHTMSFELLGSLERYSITWSDGVGIASITAMETDQDGGYNIITVTLEDGRTSTFRVRNGSQGPVNLGNIGYTLTIVSNDPASGSYYQKLGLASSAIGHLVMIYPSGQARPEIYLVSDDPNSPYYYVTLGVSSDMVGHLIYSGVGAGGA